MPRNIIKCCLLKKYFFERKEKNAHNSTHRVHYKDRNIFKTLTMLFSGYGFSYEFLEFRNWVQIRIRIQLILFEHIWTLLKTP